MVTQWLFTALVLALAGQRLAEVRLSARNEEALKMRGAVEACPGQMPWMRALHTTWLIAMLTEVWLLDRTFAPWLALVAFLAVITGQLLRYSAIRTLGDRWTVRVMVLPGAPPVASGIYSRIRHPNYLGVILEIAFFPLLHQAWITAIVFSVLNGVLLRSRIRCEEQALAETGSYEEELGMRSRFGI